LAKELFKYGSRDSARSRQSKRHIFAVIVPAFSFLCTIVLPSLLGEIFLALSLEI
jgi:hypothetical protein